MNSKTKAAGVYVSFRMLSTPIFNFALNINLGCILRETAKFNRINWNCFGNFILFKKRFFKLVNNVLIFFIRCFFIVLSTVNMA